MDFLIRSLKTKDDAQIAKIIRDNLEENGLAIPGTVYFDDILDHLSTFYAEEPSACAYYVMTDANDNVIGGVGFCEFSHFDSCVELQKIYVDGTHKGLGLGRILLAYVEERARELGFRQMYLETHTNLGIAISMYKSHGYQVIERPSCVQHSTMDTFLMKAL